MTDADRSRRLAEGIADAHTESLHISALGGGMDALVVMLHRHPEAGPEERRAYSALPTMIEDLIRRADGLSELLEGIQRDAAGG